MLESNTDSLVFQLLAHYVFSNKSKECSGDTQYSPDQEECPAGVPLRCRVLPIQPCI